MKLYFPILIFATICFSIAYTYSKEVPIQNHASKANNTSKRQIDSIKTNYPIFEENNIEREKWLQSTYGNPEMFPPNIDELQRQFSATLPVANEGMFAKGGSSEVHSQTWVHAGPNNIGGRTRAVVYDVSNANILIAGGVSGGIWRSVDGGKSWVQTSGKNEIASVTAIVQDKRKGKTNIWYFAGGEIKGNSAGTSKKVNYNGQGIYKSTDNGVTWNLLESTKISNPNNQFKFSNVIRLVIDYTKLDKDIIYAACNGSIQRSEDGGKTWLETIANSTYIYNQPVFVELVINNSGTLFAAFGTNKYGTNSSTKYGFYRSKDGLNWDDISPKYLNNEILRTVIATSGGDNSPVYFLSIDHSQSGFYCPGYYGYCYTLYRLDYNGNATWTNLSENLPYFSGINDYGIYNAQNGYNMCIAVKPDNPDVIFIGGTCLFVSNSGFKYDDCQWIAGYSPKFDRSVISNSIYPWNRRMKEWKNMMFPTGGWDFHSLVFNPKNPNIMVTGSDHGIHRINKIDQAINEHEFIWDDLNNGYNTTQFYDCSIHPNEADNEMIIGGMQDNGTWGTFSSDVDFQYMSGGDGMHSVICPNGDVLVSSQGGNLIRLIYNGDQMEDGYFLFPSNSPSIFFPFYTPFEINPNDQNALVIGGYSSITFCSDYTDQDNLKNSWNTIDYSNGFKETSALSFAESKPSLLYIGCEDNGLYKIEDINKPYDVIQIDYPPNVKYAYTADLWVNPKEEDNFISIISNYNSRSILETTDGGENWIDHGGNLEEYEDGSGNGPSVRAYSRLHYQKDTIHFVGTSAGLYSTKSLDGENTVWVREGENTIGMAVVSQIHTRDSDGKIVVSTHGNGIFKTNYSNSPNDFDGHNLGFIASEIYPNPASNEINFVLNSDKNAFVEAKLIDLQGKKIATIFSEKFEGTKKLNYNTSNLAPGTYFITFNDGSNHVTKKVSIVR